MLTESVQSRKNNKHYRSFDESTCEWPLITVDDMSYFLKHLCKFVIQIRSQNRTEMINFWYHEAKVSSCSWTTSSIYSPTRVETIWLPLFL